MFKETGARSMTLYELLGKMQPKDTGDVMAFSEFWNAMEKRGFGPMLALPAFIAATPIGAIPGVPTIAGVTILLIAMQILLGRRHPWLPATIMKIEMDAERIEFLVNKMKPVAVRFDRFLMPRWFFMRQPVFRSLIALSCAACGLLMVPLELVPLMGLIPAFAVLIMAIGMATDDGAVALFGLSIALFGFLYGGQQIALGIG